jgi:dihydrofolate reductase
VKLVVAVAANGVVGRENGLPWPRMEGDLPRFKRLTLGCAVVMGRKTWESLGYRPLPGRVNMVLSRTVPRSATTEAYVVRSLDYAEQLADARDVDLWCVGGAEVYRQALAEGRVTEMHVTRIHRPHDGDARFHLPCGWECVSSTPFADHDYEVWVPTLAAGATPRRP